MALKKECKERQHDSPAKTPVCSIEKQPTATLCPPSALHLWKTVRGRQNEHVCRLAFRNPAGLMVFPQYSTVEADPAFKADSNRWLLYLRAGGAGRLRRVWCWNPEWAAAWVTVNVRLTRALFEGGWSLNLLANAAELSEGLKTGCNLASAHRDSLKITGVCAVVDSIAASSHPSVFSP